MESSTKDNLVKDNEATKTESANPAIALEEDRLRNISGVEDYDMIHERHRIFPALFEDRNHKRILDISAGVGIVADRIKNKYSAELLCNDLSPKALSILQKNGHKTISFDLDQDGKTYPLENEQFDAVISLATIEHILDIDHFLSEICRILKEDGYLYISAPNYSGLTYLLPFLFSGKTFHDPLNKKDKYEFYAHVRYFTYRTLIEVVSQFGFETVAVYIGKPSEASRYINLKRKSPLRAKIFKLGMSTIYKLFSPRWAAEPVICFKKTKDSNLVLKPRKRIL